MPATLSPTGKSSKYDYSFADGSRAKAGDWLIYQGIKYVLVRGAGGSDTNNPLVIIRSGNDSFQINLKQLMRTNPPPPAVYDSASSSSSEEDSTESELRQLQREFAKLSAKIDTLMNKNRSS
jgi:hypothetical protein